MPLYSFGHLIHSFNFREVIKNKGRPITVIFKFLSKTDKVKTKGKENRNKQTNRITVPILYYVIVARRNIHQREPTIYIFINWAVLFCCSEDGRQSGADIQTD